MISTFSCCPVPKCPLPPAPWFCGVHVAFISPPVRERLVRFAKMYRGGRDASPPPGLRHLLELALRDIRTSPWVHWNFADKLAMLVHRLVCGQRRESQAPMRIPNSSVESAAP